MYVFSLYSNAQLLLAHAGKEAAKLTPKLIDLLDVSLGDLSPTDPLKVDVAVVAARERWVQAL